MDCVLVFLYKENWNCRPENRLCKAKIKSQAHGKKRTFIIHLSAIFGNIRGMLDKEQTQFNGVSPVIQFYFESIKCPK